MTDAPTSTSPQPRRLHRIVLVLSLATNVLLVGWIAGSALSGNDAAPRGIEPQLGAIGQLLPREERAKIGREIQRELRGRDRPQRARGAAMETVILHLEAETFDSEALTEVFRAQQGWQDEVRDVALSKFIAHVSALSAQERQVIADSLRERASRGGNRGPRAGGGD